MPNLPKNFDYKKYPILIVDDDQAFLTGFVDEFSAYFTVRQAEKAESGLKLVEENQDIALVLADQRMPGTTGVQLLAKLKTHYPDITRVLITGYADIEAAIDAINIGDIFKYISKPYKFEEVRQIIQRGIEMNFLSKERRRLELEEAEQLRKDMDAESLERINALTFGLSHHFRNKLSAAVTFFAVLPEKLDQLIDRYARGLDKDYWHNFSEKAEQGIKNVMELISDLFSSSGAGNYLFERADILKFLDSEKEVFESLAQRKQISFQYNLPKEMPLVSLDVLRMKQALENVVLNAVQAIPAAGTIKISAEEQKGELKISVADNGVGIEEENLKKVAYPFFTTKGPQTKGLGLTIADAIIRQHSGQIEIQSKPDKGTSVIIHLPLQQKEGYRQES